MKKDIIKKVADAAVDAAIHHAPEIARLGIDMVKRAKGIENSPQITASENEELSLSELTAITVNLQAKTEKLIETNERLEKELKAQAISVSKLQKKSALLTRLSVLGFIGTALSITSLVLILIK